jgi:hypothetical protein
MRTSFSLRRSWGALWISGALAIMLALSLRSDSQSHDHDDNGSDESRIKRGLDISPVELNFKGRNLALVGLGSYLVNAQCGCSDCHTSPQFALGGSPYLGQPEAINADGYLGGGRAFGTIISNNLTPDETGLPAGMTFGEFELVMRSGLDRDHSLPPVPNPDNDLLQVMPWPVFKEMTDRDMRAIYEYLRAIPSVP